MQVNAHTQTHGLILPNDRGRCNCKKMSCFSSILVMSYFGRHLHLRRHGGERMNKAYFM
jgi:hypothetical protein